MRKIIFLFIFLLFIVNRDAATFGAVEGLSIWSKSVFPILFPTFIISDMLLSSGLINSITKYFGKIFSCLFNSTVYSAYIFLLSLLAGTPTNAKNLKMLYDNNYIDSNDLTKILSFSYFFNPFFIIGFANVKILLIIWISNIITGIVLKNVLPSKTYEYKSIKVDFNLNTSIQNNMNILISILGTIVIFSVLSNIIPIENIFIKTIVSGFLEVTNGLYRINTYFSGNEYLYIIILSLGGLSIFTQIKSILKDTKINYLYLLASRIISMMVGLIICCLT